MDSYHEILGVEVEVGFLNVESLRFHELALMEFG